MRGLPHPSGTTRLISSCYGEWFVSLIQQLSPRSSQASAPLSINAVCFAYPSLCQSSDAFFPNPPHIFKTPSPDRLHIVTDPISHELAVQCHFVRANLCRDDRFLMQKLDNRFCGVCARSCHINTHARIDQVAMRLRE